MRGRRTSKLWRAGAARPRGAFPALALAALALAAGPLPARATRFVDVRGNDNDSIHLVRTVTWTLRGNPGEVTVILAHPEPLPPGSEMAVFNQTSTAEHEGDPPADLEERYDWFSRLTWFPGSFTDGSRLTVRTTMDVEAVADVNGLARDLTRMPGEYYTDYTETIQYVPGIEEAIRFIDGTAGTVPGVPGGNIGIAQRWMAYVCGVIEAGPCPAPGARIDDAAWAWSAGVADCDGLANVFASGMRTLDFPTCVVIGYLLDGGPMVGGIWIRVPEANWHAWAGVWSEDEGAFIPFDLGQRQAGFLNTQRVHFAYHDDLTHQIEFVTVENGQVDLVTQDISTVQTTDGTQYSVIRERNLNDGYPTEVLAHDVTGTRAPGDGTSGVDDSAVPAAGPAALVVSSPFRSVLSVSLRLPGADTVDVDLFDAAGRRVASLARGRRLPAGESFLRWLPGGAPSGVYFVRVVTRAGERLTAHAVLLR